jgi:hypothetical protein
VLQVRPYVLAILLVATLGFGPGTAQAKGHSTLHCKHGYVKKLVTVKEHKHGHVIRVKAFRCVKAPAPAPSSKTISVTSGPVPIAPAPTPVPPSAPKAPEGGFCSTHTCIPNFENGRGYPVECADGMWSKSGGISGACSGHGGESGKP